MANFRIDLTSTVDGTSYRNSLEITTDNKANSTPVVQTADAGVLTTRTDNDTGVVTMAQSGHGINTGDRVDVYWTVAGTAYKRYGVTVGTVSGTSVPIDLGSGDNLPTVGTDIILAVCDSEPVAMVGDDVQAFVLYAGFDGYVVVTQANNTVITAQYLTAGQSFTWHVGNGITNPLAGVSVGKVFFSHKDTTSSREMRAEFLYN